MHVVFKSDSFFRRPVDTANNWNRVACNISANPEDGGLLFVEGELISTLAGLIIPQQGLNISGKRVYYVYMDGWMDVLLVEDYY